MKFIELYNKYFKDRSFERRDLLEKIAKKYQITSALYPGSFLHMTPSFYIPTVTYVDSDKQAVKAFKEKDVIDAFVEKNKVYTEERHIQLLGESYFNELPIEEQVDFLFSQYAGPISQACKKYLKKGGILVANNSHADAGIAFLDPDYELIAVAHNRGENVRISENDLDSYFIPKKAQKSLEELLESGKGIGYTKTADNYIFKKIS